jgi:hypothetical protein
MLFKIVFYLANTLGATCVEACQLVTDSMPFDPEPTPSDFQSAKIPEQH